MAYENNYEGIFESGDEEALESMLGLESKWEEAGERWEESDEESRLPRYRPGPVSLPIRRTPFRPIGGVAGANIQTPAGRAQVQFGKPVATQEAVNNLARELKSEIASLAASVKKVNQTVDKNTTVLDKKVNTINVDFKKAQQNSQMMMLLPMLMSKTPEISEIQMKEKPDTEDTYNVEKTVYKAADNTMMMMLPFMMMPGGGSMDSMSMMMFALMLSGGFDKK